MTTQICLQAPCVELENLDNLWIQLSNDACNLKCRHCLLKTTAKYNNKSFLHIEKIKSNLRILGNKEVKNIYLTGGEPMLHPDFNNIVRLLLKRTNVTVLTNATMINDKKARFLKGIEDNHNYELIFRVSLDHYDEKQNDSLRGKGNFRRTLMAIDSLVKHGFNPIISVVNYWNEPENQLKENFSKLFLKIDFETEDINYKILPVYKTGSFAINFSQYSSEELVLEQVSQEKAAKLDCYNSRVITPGGIYSCPALVGDPRGFLGNDFNDFSTKTFLETSSCYTCMQENKQCFNNNF